MTNDNLKQLLLTGKNLFDRECHRRERSTFLHRVFPDSHSNASSTHATVCPMPEEDICPWYLHYNHHTWNKSDFLHLRERKRTNEEIWFSCMQVFANRSFCTAFCSARYIFFICLIFFFKPNVMFFRKSKINLQTDLNHNIPVNSL